MVCRPSSARGLAILPELETPRLTLRRLQFDDAPFLVGLLNQPSFIENIGDRGVRSIEDAHRYLREGPMAMYDKYRLRPVAHGAQATACPSACAACSSATTCPTSTSVMRSCRSSGARGSPSRRPRPRCVTARRNSASTRVIGVVSEGNAASIRVLEKLGMSFERMFSMRPDEPEVRLYGRTL